MTPGDRAGRRISRALARSGLAVAGLGAVLMGLRAWDARSIPDLQAWHRFAPASEFRAGSSGIDDLAAYMTLEDRVFREVAESVGAGSTGSDRRLFDRYASGSWSDPGAFGLEGNRSFELFPDTVRGGALLLHGLTDSPYSVRSLARVLRNEGFYVLALRMPGHGTVPGALLDVRWQDWTDAVRLGVRHVADRVGSDVPLVLGGYSNGGALAVHYVLDALEDPELPRPETVLLLSPALAVSPAAIVAGWHRLVSFAPPFEKLRWHDVRPEYDPFKYNSFPKNAARQIHLLTRSVRRRLADLEASGGILELPAFVTFQSVVDATVDAGATVDVLYDRLPENGSALVLFDVNRLAALEPLLGPADPRSVGLLEESRPLPYRVTLVTNADPGTLEVVARHRPAGDDATTDEVLGLGWPDAVYSLSHVAVPFPPDDPLYGAVPPPPGTPRIHLGRIPLQGERGVLVVPGEDLVRLRHNPFFEYLARRVTEAVGRRSPGPGR